ncbi:DeoR/GlpR family DNA-binding transcription regulator [Pararhizobium sp.]|uniref:DeoR/GlpR family DNA-binding transcription regulator n=1 Tax=Pararhizobium sp. TaxID=1977563 RepID=UPI0027260067|nr:DeoR/GlpR family DNA-binding transcription regulator [Pararhizobium sp.]MDO9416729.1 DeoR/GlpR family DNA-binding transcription regulator [Pararhizobium sp.]
MASRKQSRILLLTSALAERRVIHFKDAAELMGVSEMTVRRDVSDNPDLFGFLGGHIVPATDVEPDAPYELSRAADSHAAAKKQACSHAVKYIRAEETVFVDCGTTLGYLIDLLPAELPLTVVCYALNIAEKLARRPNVALIMIGGLYHPASASFSGNPGLETLGYLGINVAFLSAAGIDSKRGATCANFHEAEIKRKVISLARKNVLVADSSKIGKLKPAFFADLSAFDAIITENGDFTALPENSLAE